MAVRPRAERHRFRFRFTGANKAMIVLGLAPRTCYIDVTDDELIVRFSWAFQSRVPRSSITSVSDDTAPILGWGAHGWRHVWLLNGTSRDLLRIDIEPMARGRVLLVPLRLRALRVGMEDTAGFRRAIAPG